MDLLDQIACLISRIDSGLRHPNLEHDLRLEVVPDLSELEIGIALTGYRIEDHIATPTSFDALHQCGSGGGIEGDRQIAQQCRAHQWFRKNIPASFTTGGWEMNQAADITLKNRPRKLDISAFSNGTGRRDRQVAQAATAAHAADDVLRDLQVKNPSAVPRCCRSRSSAPGRR